MSKPNHVIRTPSTCLTEFHDKMSGSKVSEAFAPSSGLWDLWTHTAQPGGAFRRVNPYTRYGIRATLRAVNLFQAAPDGMAWNSLTNGDYLHGGQIGVIADGVDSWDDLEAEALGRLNATARGGVDLSIDLLQHRQTAELFRVTDRVYSETLRFSKKIASLKGLRGAARRIAGYHLEWIYGIKPLLSTVYGIAEEVHRRQAALEYKLKGKSKSISALSKVQVYTLNNTYEELPFDGVLERCVKYGVWLSDDGISQLGDFTSMNPLSIAWELTPWSFVADWFIDVGGYLRNLETAAMLAPGFRDGFMTRSYRYNGTFHGTFSGTVTVTFVDRSQIYTWPTPNLPRFKAQLGSSRLIAAAALLTQALPAIK